MAAPVSSDSPGTEDKIKSKLSFIYERCVREGECLIVCGRSTTRNGYPRHHLRYPGHGEVNTTLHRAVFILEERRPDLIRNPSAGEVSHRCGVKTCVEMRHLVLESSADNNRRKDCHAARECYHGCLPPCIIRTGWASVKMAHGPKQLFSGLPKSQKRLYFVSQCSVLYMLRTVRILTCIFHFFLFSVSS